VSLSIDEGIRGFSDIKDLLKIKGVLQNLKKKDIFLALHGTMKRGQLGSTTVIAGCFTG